MNTFTVDGRVSKENPITKDLRLNNNVVEKVIIPKAEDEKYAIEVIGKKLMINGGGQPFVIVSSRVKSTN